MGEHKNDPKSQDSIHFSSSCDTSAKNSLFIFLPSRKPSAIFTFRWRHTPHSRPLTCQLSARARIYTYVYIGHQQTPPPPNSAPCRGLLHPLTDLAVLQLATSPDRACSYPQQGRRFPVFAAPPSLCIPQIFRRLGAVPSEKEKKSSKDPQSRPRPAARS